MNANGLSLLVVYEGADDLDGRNVRLSNGAASDLKEIGLAWVNALESYDEVAYEATAELAESEAFLIGDPDVLSDLDPLYRLVTSTPDLPTVSVDDLDERIGVYGVVAGGDEPVALLKKSDPRIGYTGGRRYLAVFNERLQRLEDPAFAFYSSFDFVLGPDWTLVVHQGNFERLFREASVVQEQINSWVASVGEHLPWSDGSVDALSEVAHRDSRVWRRLREIHRRGHLASVSIGQVRDYAVRMELEVEHLIEGEQLVFDPAERFSILHLLNEDLFLGPLTNERFEAQRKVGAG